MTSTQEIGSLQTPALVLDRSTLVRNCDRMREKALRSGVAFRPHVKTHKVPGIGRIQHGGAPGPITVSTLAEAESFADEGFGDITYAVPIAPDKLSRVRDLMLRVKRLNILVDNEGALEALEAFDGGEGRGFDVFLKVDCGYHRAGVDPDSPSSVAFAKRLGASKSVRFHGLLTHAGHSYNATSAEQILKIAHDEREAVRRFAARVATEGVGPLIRSIGSTPTASLVETFEGVDEVRPGNYVFYDAFQATIGSCTLKDCAVSVLTSVIGIYREENRLMLDAGALALSKDTGPDHLIPRFGYGIVCDLALQRLPLRIDALSQEHGKVSVDGEFDFDRIAIGSKLRIIPNHSCLTSAMFDRYHVVDGSLRVDEWKPVRGW